MPSYIFYDWFRIKHFFKVNPKKIIKINSISFNNYEWPICVSYRPYRRWGSSLHIINITFCFDKVAASGTRASFSYTIPGWVALSMHELIHELLFITVTYTSIERWTQREVFHYSTFPIFFSVDIVAMPFLPTFLMLAQQMHLQYWNLKNIKINTYIRKDTCTQSTKS